MTENQELITTALRYYGVTEVAGKKDNPIIVNFFKSLGFDFHDEISWCSAFVNAVANDCYCESSNSLAARSWLKCGFEPTDVKQGDIVIFWRESPRSWKGHVGFYVQENDTHIYVLGGNQSNMVCIQKYPKTRLLGIRRLKKVDTFRKKVEEY